MIEYCEFRVNEEFAHLLFRRDEGKVLGLGLVRRVVVNVQDPIFKQIRELDAKCKKNLGKPFYFGWRLFRKYTTRERMLAEYFLFTITGYSDISSGNHGTKFDKTVSCPECGIGTRQTGPLYFFRREMPKTKDIFRLDSNEVIISKRFADLLSRYSPDQLHFGPIRLGKGRSEKIILADPKNLKQRKWRAEPIVLTDDTTEATDEWVQLFVETGESVLVIPPTRAGLGPFGEPDIEMVETCNHLLGRSLLSEVTFKRNERLKGDIFVSRQVTGGALFGFKRITFVSNKIRQLIEQLRIKGCTFEIAHCES